MRKQRLTKAAIVSVRSLGRGLEVFADMLGFFAEKKLSFRQAILATLIIFATLILTIYILGCNGCRQSNAAEYLSTLAWYIERDLQERGRCVLAEARESWENGFVVTPPCLLWTDVKFISNGDTYEGRIVCWRRRSDFGIFATFTTALALKPDRQKGGYRIEIVYPKGRPDFIRLGDFRRGE